MTTLEDYYNTFNQVDGVKAIYLLDMQSKKIQNRILDTSLNKLDMIDNIKKISSYLRKGEFDMIYIETIHNLNIFLKNISTNDTILIIVADKNLVIGSMFSLLKNV